MDAKTKATLLAAFLAMVVAYAIGWIAIMHQPPIPAIQELTAVIVTLVIFLLAFSYLKRNPPL